MSEEKRPEQYWIERGPEHIVGVEGPVQGVRTNQAPVYEKVAELIRDLGVRQVVEIGCNVGQQALFLKRSGFAGEFVGIDSNLNAVKVAQQNLADADNYTFEEGNLRWLDIRGYSKECVISKDVIEHLESYDLLRNMLEIARKYVIIASFIPWFRREPSRIVKTGEGYYMNTYNLNEIKELAEECHFAVRDIYEVAAFDGTVNQVVVFERVKKSPEPDQTPSLESPVIGEPVPHSTTPGKEEFFKNLDVLKDENGEAVDVPVADLADELKALQTVTFTDIEEMVSALPDTAAPPTEYIEDVGYDVPPAILTYVERDVPAEEYHPATNFQSYDTAEEPKAAHPDDQAVADAAPKNVKPAPAPEKSKGGKKTK